MTPWITGAGLVTSLGAGVETCFSRLVRGDRALAPVTLFDAAGLRGSIVGEVTCVPKDASAAGVLDGASGAAWSRSSEMAILAAREALESAGISRVESIVRHTRVGLVVGGTTAGMFETEALLADLVSGNNERAALSKMLSHPMSAIADRMELEIGPFARVRTVASACSSGANALIVAADWIESGEIDLVLAGATDGLCRLTLAGFNALSAVDAEPCRPFDRRRRGTNLGEGAGFVVMESARHAKARGATPICALAGWAAGSEAHHVTNPEPLGRVASGLMERALLRAKMSAGDIDYVNAHGTATPLNDAMEAKALADAFGADISRVFVSSSKGQVGHTLGASGAIEAVITALAVAKQIVPPTAGLEEPDEACTLRHVIGEGQKTRVRAAMSNAFGFGGMDAVLVMREVAARDAEEENRVRRSVVITGAAAWIPAGLADARSLPLGPMPSPAITEDPTALLDVERTRRLDRGARLLVATIARATPDIAKDTGIVTGAGFGRVDGSARFMSRVFERGARFASPADFPGLVPSAAAGHASVYFGTTGPTLATADLVASGESAFAEGVDLVRAGEASRVIACGAEVESALIGRVLAEVFGDHDAPARRAEGAFAVALSDEATAEGHAIAHVDVTLAWRDDRISRGNLPEFRDGDAIFTAALAYATHAVRDTPWSRAKIHDVAPATGTHEVSGGIAVVFAVGAIARREVSRALVVGGGPGRGYAVLLSSCDS